MEYFGMWEWTISPLRWWLPCTVVPGGADFNGERKEKKRYPAQSRRKKHKEGVMVCEAMKMKEGVYEKFYGAP